MASRSVFDAMTRRRFLGTAAAGFFTVFSGCSRKAIWPARGSEKGSVRVLFYTDVHTHPAWQIPDALAQAAAAINAQKPDLVIAGGDLITGGFQSSAATVAPRWDEYMKMHRAIRGDVYPVIGNHDLVAAIPEDGTLPAEDPRFVYRQKMDLGRIYYSFDAVGYHFIMLDSIQVTGDKYKYQGKIRREQLEWLKQDLARVPHGTPIVLATHIPLLSSFYLATEGATCAAKKNRVIVNNLDVLRLINAHNVILVLQGHLHVKELIMWRGTTFIVGGAICGKWWRGPWHGTQEGFSTLTLTGNRVYWEYIDYGWKARRP
jgi:3',5'-cyclic AMP phosphodiesterase CpdA